MKIFRNIILFIVISMLAGCGLEIKQLDYQLDLSFSTIANELDPRDLKLDIKKFKTYKSQIINFNKSTNLAVFKFKINDVIAKNVVVVVEHKYLDNVSYFVETPDNSHLAVEKLYRFKSTKNRIFSSEKYVFRLKNNANSTHYIVVRNSFDTVVSVRLYDADLYTQYDKKTTIFFTLLYASMFGLFLVNLIYYLYIRDKSYLYFSLFIVVSLYAYLHQESRMIDLPFLFYPLLGYYDKIIYFNIASILAFLFIKQFLNLHWRTSIVGKILYFLNINAMLTLTVVLFLYFWGIENQLIVTYFNNWQLLNMIVIVVISFLESRKNNQQARFLFFSWLVFFIFTTFRIIYVLNPLPNQFWAQHSYEIGMLLASFIITLGLGNKALNYRNSRDMANESYNIANKALLAETLINNFLYEVKNETIGDDKVKDFLGLIEDKFAEMMMKFAPINAFTRLSIKDGVCIKNKLFHKNINDYFKLFYRENKPAIIQASFNANVQSMIFKTGIDNNRIQFLIVPLTVKYSADNSDSECLVLELLPNKILDTDEISHIKKFIDKSIAVLIDSRELKEMAKHAQKIISIAEQQDKSMRMKDKFFANVSHELRTPLTLTIAPLKDLDEQRHLLNTSGKYLVDTALKNAEDLLDLVNKILDIQKLSSGEYPLKVTKVDCNKLIFQVMKKLINWSLDHQQNMNFENQQQDIILFCDKNEITKVLTNIVSNAIKYSGENSNIDISIEQDDKWLKIHVKDDGKGIDKSITSKIFERYYQAESAQHITEAGTGIGLSYVKEIMELHYGKITLESEVDRGSIFTLWFKQGYEHFDEKQMFEPDEKSVLKGLININQTDESNTSVENKNDITTLLIIEDNHDLRKYLCFKFANHYQVIEAKNGKIGLEKAIDLLPDVILSDIMMPEMDGVNLVKNVRKNPNLKTVPIILLTAKSTNTNKVDGLNIGADDYVTKPFDFKELKARIDRLIASRKAIKQEFNYQPGLTKDKVKSAFQDKLDDAINQNISDGTLNVEKLSEILFMERSTLYRKIKREFNITPIVYIRNTRLEYSCQLLKDKKLSVSQTAYTCGFESLSYFSKQFKKYYGMPPSEI